MNELSYKIKLFIVKKYFFKEITLTLILIGSTAFYHFLGAWIGSMIVLIIFLTLIVNLFSGNTQTEENVLDDILIKESSEKYSVNHSHGWKLEFEKLPIKDNEKFYRIWDNIDLSRKDL